MSKKKKAVGKPRKRAVKKAAPKQSHEEKKRVIGLYLLEDPEQVELESTMDEMLEGVPIEHENQNLELDGDTNKGKITGYFMDRSDNIVGFDLKVDYKSDSPTPLVSKKDRVVKMVWRRQTDANARIALVKELFEGHLYISVPLKKPIHIRGKKMMCAVFTVGINKEAGKGRVTRASFISSAAFPGVKGDDLIRSLLNWRRVINKYEQDDLESNRVREKKNWPKKRFPFEEPTVDHHKVQEEFLFKLLEREYPNIWKTKASSKIMGFIVDYTIQHGKLPTVDDAQEHWNNPEFLELLKKPKIRRKTPNHDVEWWIGRNWLNIRALRLEEIAQKLEDETGILQSARSIEYILNLWNLPRAVSHGRPETHPFDDNALSP